MKHFSKVERLSVLTHEHAAAKASFACLPHSRSIAPPHVTGPRETAAALSNHIPILPLEVSIFSSLETLNPKP